MIPIADPVIGDQAKERAMEVLDSGRLTGGPEVEAFEDEFSDFCDTRAGVATSNGTTALHAALRACGIGPGDAVVTTPFSFVASANAVRLVGAEPIFGDIDPSTYTLDPESVRRVVRETENVAAILPVHLYGLPADMGPLLEIADDNDLFVIEDAAQAHGAEYDDRPVGSLGDVGCFSFYPTKNMTTGEGGMIVTDDPDVESTARRFIDHGRANRDLHVETGHNFRMPAVAAAIGRVQLQALPNMNEARRENAEQLTRGLTDTPLTLPAEPANRHHVYHQYTVRTERRDELAATLSDADVGSRVYYPRVIPDQPAYDDVSVDCAVARRAAAAVLSVPVHPAVSSADVDRIVEIIEGFFDE